jgi:hypothetical protein
MSSSSKRQQTMAKRAREQRVKERRALKLEKKHAAAVARHEKAAEAALAAFPKRPPGFPQTPPEDHAPGG